MGSLPQETEAMLWKFTALLWARGLFKKKTLEVDEIAKFGK